MFSLVQSSHILHCIFFVNADNTYFMFCHSMSYMDWLTSDLSALNSSLIELDYGSRRLILAISLVKGITNVARNSDKKWLRIVFSYKKNTEKKNISIKFTYYDLNYQAYSQESTLVRHFFVKYFQIACVHICISLNTNKNTPIHHTCLTSSWSCLCFTAGYLMIPLWFWVLRVKRTKTIASSWFHGKVNFSEISNF